MAPPIFEFRTPEQEAQDIMANTAVKISDMLGKSISALPVMVGLGRAPTVDACDAAARKITEMFGGAILSAIEGERAIEKLKDQLAAAVPADHVVVPRTPTAAMLQGACDGHVPDVPMNDGTPCPRFEARKRIWADMIANSAH